MHWLDRIVIWGIAALVGVTPLAIGSAHPWAFKPMEVVMFLLSAAWMAKLWWRDESLPGNRGFGLMLIPGAAFLILVIFQQCSLPPWLMKMVSPSTYALYAKTLPGWPDEAPYLGFHLDAQVSARPTASADAPIILPSADQVRNGSRALPFAVGGDVARPLRQGAAAGPKPQAPIPAQDNGGARWRPLSLAPTLSYPALLKALAFSALFLVVLCYPFGDGEEQAEKNFYRTILSAILLAGVLVAVIGLAERVAWNGKILWFFVPTDWGAPMVSGLPRASGPFVNPDHFANYLAMVLPLALAAGLFPTMLAPAREPGPFRIACLGAALLIFSAIVLSLSRGGWTGAILGLLVLFALYFRVDSPKLQRQDSATRGRQTRSRHSLKLSFPVPVRRLLPALCLLGLGTLLLLSLVLVGPEGRDQTSARLQQTTSGGGNLLFRVATWKDSLRMTRDFPILGVGFGAWPELFPRYRGAPWSTLFMREAHNDYVQLLAETGLVGLCAAAAFFIAAGKQLLSGFARLDKIEFPLLAAIAGGVLVMGVHEFFDFSFRIPANALLFTVLFALGVRMTCRRPGGIVIAQRRWSLCSIVVFLLLAGAAAAQQASAYEYDAPVAKTAAQARNFVLQHPASSRAHLALALTLPDSSQERRELERAAWLAPTDPHPRDIFAQYLAREGEAKAAAQQIALSVFNSPDWGTHFYLNPTLILWLSPDEHKAIESGFKRALAENYGGAVEGLGRFYDTLGDFSDEADMYAGAAAREKSASTRAIYLVDAGEAYVRAGDRRGAEKEFLGAERNDPASPRAYDELLYLVYGPEAKMALARATVGRGIANGVDPAGLYSSLAVAAQRAGDSALAQDAMVKVVQYAPTFDNTMRLGAWYLQAGKLDLAVAALEQAVRMNPASSDAYHLLAVAKELSYDYPAADNDYARAIALDPRNVQFQREYSAFRQRIGYAKAP